MTNGNDIRQHGYDPDRPARGLSSLCERCGGPAVIVLGTQTAPHPPTWLCLSCHLQPSGSLPVDDTSAVGQ